VSKTGLQAFHVCKAETPAGEPLHRNVTEVLEFVVPALGYSPDQVDGMMAAVQFNEQVVGYVGLDGGACGGGCGVRGVGCAIRQTGCWVCTPPPPPRTPFPPPLLHSPAHLLTR